MARILVLGGYGLIGSAISRHLIDAGHAVIILGRDAKSAERVLPGVAFIEADMALLLAPSDWRTLIKEHDFVVNCAGALQDGTGVDLEAIHARAIAALAMACADQDTGLIQISAVRANADDDLQFLASKGRGDDAIRASGARYWIFRPGLVLGETAYGGTQLLRSLAAVPLIQPLAMADARVQTVGLQDVARIVAGSVSGDVPPGTDIDLVEEQSHTFRELVAAMRTWLGFRPARFELICPSAILRLVSCIADRLGDLGWRSPLRSTALAALSNGVTGTAPPPEIARLSPLSETLRYCPARHEDRVSARASLIFPLVIAVLSAFWVLSGLIGLIRLDAAASVLTEVGWTWGVAALSVVFWASIDIALGVLVLVRRHGRRALLGMVIVSLFYLGAATVLTPWLWFDPLGALVKTVPAICLALVGLVFLESR